MALFVPLKAPILVSRDRKIMKFPHLAKLSLRNCPKNSIILVKFVFIMVNFIFQFKNVNFIRRTHESGYLTIVIDKIQKWRQQSCRYLFLLSTQIFTVRKFKYFTWNWIICVPQHYAPETFKHKVKILQFSCTQILCEIKFWWIQTVKKCHFWQFRGSKLWFW